MFDADIEAALADLPPDFRAAVVLCDVEGLTYEEIAGVLDLKMGTVRSRIHRGRAMLRTALAHRAPKDGRRALRRSRPRGASTMNRHPTKLLASLTPDTPPDRSLRSRSGGDPKHSPRGPR